MVKLNETEQKADQTPEVLGSLNNIRAEVTLGDRPTQAQDADTLENIIDRRSLCEVLAILECICEDKAIHIRHDWQDQVTCKPWEKLSNRLSRIALLAQQEGI